jgi:MFS family permease
VSAEPEASAAGDASPRLALLLAAAMFVLVVDTSFMNVSISAVVRDLDTTASGVQSAIALEALVSAAFILINSKMGDLIGRKRAYVIGLLAYAVGALAMTLTQSLTPVIIFWAIVGGLGASLLLPAMQSLIHGNFTGAAQKKTYALVGASAAIAAAIGPLLGGFVTTYLSWRVGFGLEVLIILVVLSQIRLVKDVPYTGPRRIDLVGAVLSVVGMGGVVLGILVWQEGGGYVGLIIGVGVATLAGLAYWLVTRQRAGKPTLLDPDLFKHLNFRIGVSQQMLQQITLAGAMIALPLFLQMTLEYNAMQAGLALAPLSLSMFGMALLAGRRAGERRPANIVLAGFALSLVGIAAIIPLVPRVHSGWYLVIPLIVAGSGLGLLVSQLNNFTLAPIAEDRVSEAAGVNSAAGSFGLLLRLRSLTIDRF